MKSNLFTNMRRADEVFPVPNKLYPINPNIENCELWAHREVSTRLCFIYRDEESLNDGRFRNFLSYINKTYDVVIISYEYFSHDWLNSIFDWINDNVNDKWTSFYDHNYYSDHNFLKIEFQHSFGFKSETDAMHFALRWK